MTRKTTRRHAQGDASRKTILDATLRLAGEHGYVGTTMSQVKKASGLPASSLYWHFQSKDELLADALDHGFALWHAHATRWASEPHGERLSDALLVELRKGTSDLGEEPGFWRMGLMLALESGPAVGDRPRERFLQIRGDALGTLRAWWSKAVDTTPELHTTLAQLTLAALDGLFLRQQGEGDLNFDLLLRHLADGLAEVAARVVATGSTTIYGAPARPQPVHPRMALAEPASGRVRLLEAAHQVAAESGYEGATISRICAAAGLPASSLYWHFKDKDTLFAEVVEHSYREWSLTQPEWLDVGSAYGWEDELRSHLAATVQSLTEQPPFLRLGYLLLLLNRTDPTPGRDRFVGVRRQVRLITSTWFAEAIGADATGEGAEGRLEPELLSQLLMAICDGLFFSQCFDAPVWTPEVYADLTTCLLAASARRRVG